MQQVAEVKPSRGSAIGEQTFADLLQPLIEPGFRLALAMLHDPQAAEDAVQEASFTAWRKLARMHDQGKLRPWFLGVVANKCRNARRTKWIVIEVDSSPKPGPGPKDPANPEAEAYTP